MTGENENSEASADHRLRCALFEKLSEVVWGQSLGPGLEASIGLTCAMIGIAADSVEQAQAMVDAMAVDAKLAIAANWPDLCVARQAALVLAESRQAEASPCNS